MQHEATARSPDAWIKKCAALALLVVAASVAYYFFLALPRESTARLEMERQERLAAEQRERQKVERQQKLAAEQTEREKLEMQRQADEAVDEQLSRGHVWPHIQLPFIRLDRSTLKPLGNVNASLRTSWRDGRLYYRLTLGPTTRGQFWLPSKGGFVDLLQSHGDLFVDLLDSSGFKVKEIDVPATSLTRIHDARSVETSQTAQGIEANESVPFSRSDYLRIDGWNLRWEL
jgi:hypothetical protein